MENKNDKKDQFVELRAKGNSYDSIAKKIGVSKGTLINWSHDLQLDIKNYQNMEADALLEKYRMSKNSQLESLGEQLVKIRDEVSKRDLSNVPTEKLVAMEIKLLDSINNNERTHITLGFEGWDTRLDNTTTWDA